jgi:predicted phage terminase large subunit-like protein
VLRNFHYSQPRLEKAELAEMVGASSAKVLWFMQRGYQPHYYQLLFHCSRDESGRIYKDRHLVAGRRGGKTLSAAWDTAFYLHNPQWYWWDFHGKSDCHDPLWIWELSENYKIGNPALLTFRKVLKQAGSQHGIDYKENRGNKYFEFIDGSLFEFKSADDPESLRGAGLHILWKDEAAFIRTRHAYDVVSPALADNDGALVTTTTPDGKNWFHEEFWSEQAIADERSMRVEYTSMQNPHLSLEIIDRYRRAYHPMMFKQEFEAAFDSMAGKELHGDWLHYYGAGCEFPAPVEKDLDLFIGVDPAISQSEKADRFAISLVGITKDRHKAYLLEQWAGRIPFPEQVTKINEWFFKYRPQIIGVESVAYQAALVQQLERQPNFAPVIPIMAKGKKFERIIAMSPFFKIGKVLISKRHADFIDEWISYDPEIRNPKDDCLDSVEIALRTAGALMELPDIAEDEIDDPTDHNKWAKQFLPRDFRVERDDYDHSMGDDW